MVNCEKNTKFSHTLVKETINFTNSDNLAYIRKRNEKVNKKHGKVKKYIDIVHEKVYCMGVERKPTRARRYKHENN